MPINLVIWIKKISTMAHALPPGSRAFRAVLDEISNYSDDERLRYWVARTQMDLRLEAGLLLLREISLD